MPLPPLAVAAAAEVKAGDVRIPKGEIVIEPASYDWPPFTNWDCVDVRGVLDWDLLYARVMEALIEGGAATFHLPEEVVQVLQFNGVSAYEECPLGTLYFLVLYTYEMMGGMGSKDQAVIQAETLVTHLRKYPFFIIAAARWPTYEAMHHFAPLHAPQNPNAAKNTLCEGVRGGSGIDWDVLLQAALAWSAEQLRGLEPGEGRTDHGKVLKAAADAVYRDPRVRGPAAQDECPFGFLFLSTTQVLASAMRLTGAFEAWARALDRILAELPFFSIAGSQWPTFQMLAMFSSLSKGNVTVSLKGFQADIHRWGGSHPVSKRFRQYGDLRLREDELSPIGSGPLGWERVDQLVALTPQEWYTIMVQRRLLDVRPMFGNALEALLQAVRSSTFPWRRECGHSGISPELCRARGCSWLDPKQEGAGDEHPSCRHAAPKRKVVAVTFVWGEKWAPLVPRFAAWTSRLGMTAVVVAMGEACRHACESAAAALGGIGSGAVACWDPLKGGARFGGGDPERGSILQRHAMVHLLLHTGIDALAFDFDTFFFSDPRPRLEALAEEKGADVLMTRHLDADCLNMGLIYIRASSRTAEWYSRYLQWLHQHPYEREQRGANNLLGFTQQSISFPPANMPVVKPVALDDLNEFASSRGGWLGDWSKLRFFHWVNPATTLTNWGDIKYMDLKALYEAALHHTTDIRSYGNSLAAALVAAQAGSFLEPIREIMESLRVETPPERHECW